MKKFTPYLIIIALIFGFLFVLSGTPAMAQDNTRYEMLAPLPYVTPANETTTTAKKYLEGSVKLIIAIGTILAVLMIIYGGVKYMSTDAFSGKSEAKGVIKNAFSGLALVLGAWIILNTISPNLVNFNLSIERFEPGKGFEGRLGSGIPPTEGEMGSDRETLGCPACMAITEEIGAKIGTTPPKLPGPRGSGAGCENTMESGTCYIYGPLAAKLMGLTLETNKLNEGISTNTKYGWRVNEMLPPTVDHKQLCHAVKNSVTGMCVDVSVNVQCAGLTLASGCSPSTWAFDAKKIGAFMKYAYQLGMHVEYELAEGQNTRKDQLTSEIKKQFPNESFPIIIFPVTGVRNEHFSVYYNRDAKK
jgi:hypothetical protein